MGHGGVWDDTRARVAVCSDVLVTCFAGVYVCVCLCVFVCVHQAGDTPADIAAIHGHVEAHRALQEFNAV